MGPLTTQEARERFSDIVRHVADEKERVIVTRDGEQLVAIVPLEDLALVQAMEDRLDIEDAQAALKEAQEEGTISLGDLKKELGL